MTSMAPSSSRAGTTTIWVIVGLVCGLAPAWLFVIAAFAGPGPRTSVLLFAAPVLASTAIAIWASLRLARAGHRRLAITVGVIALVAGVLAYAAWIYLAALGLQFGDGPF